MIVMAIVVRVLIIQIAAIRLLIQLQKILIAMIGVILTVVITVLVAIICKILIIVIAITATIVDLGDRVSRFKALRLHPVCLSSLSPVLLLSRMLLLHPFKKIIIQSH